MCGIIGYIGNRQATPILLDGLKSLEYRGYDSSGIAVSDNYGGTLLFKAAGKLTNLEASLQGEIPNGTMGIGHTRWATHGAATDLNAHPHTDCIGDVTVVHNGIIENYVELRDELLASRHTFASETDAECVPHLIESYISEGKTLAEAVISMAKRLSGANTLVVMHAKFPGELISVKLGNAGGLIVGHGNEEIIVTSDLAAMLPYSNQVSYLSKNEVAIMKDGHVRYTDLDENDLEKQITLVPYDPRTLGKGTYKHFMLKEIFEQPEVAGDSIRGRVSFDNSRVDMDLPFNVEEIVGVERIVIVGMGTSLHAAMIGRLWMESLTGIPCEADNSSEFRYRSPVVDGKTLVISISQSGETADTLAAMEEARTKGAIQLTLCNTQGSQSSQVADGTIPIRAGPEIAVASTKTFVCSLIALYLTAIEIGIVRGHLSDSEYQHRIKGIARIPGLLGDLLTRENLSLYEALADKYFRKHDFLFLGRGLNFPIAMEGALKLKEVSYIHAEGYPAGEMKHGPISLIDEDMPVVALVPKDRLYEKMISNIHEVKARGGIVIAVATEGDMSVFKVADEVMFVPDCSEDLIPILMCVPMQLLSYYVAVRLGLDVDQPRNLAKSVTVE